jgi:NAD+ kinase
MQSPCYVHSHLDKSASLAEWLRSKQPQSPPPPIDVSPILRGDSRSQRHKNLTANSHSGIDDEDDDDEFNDSLTKQLADTAVGVREMSKQLGQYTCIPRESAADH